MKQIFSLLSIVVVLAAVAEAREATHQVGVAEVDITPGYPVRLNGFASRLKESEGVTLAIKAKALAIGDEKRGPAIVLTVDSLGVPDYMTGEVAKRLAEKKQIDPARVAITSTHTHTAPMLTGCCPTIYGQPIPAEHQEKIDRYTRELTDKLEQVALAALADLRPATLEWGVGRVGFSINRRTPGGPVDHDLPVLVVRHPDGKIRAIYLSYACHCVTLSNFKVSGDWAGFAAEQIEKSYPGALALTSVGCGADSNPSSGVTGDKEDIARGQGKQIADEVDRLIKAGLTAVTEPVETRLNRIVLPFDTLPTREQWEERTKRPGAEGYHARVNLARLDRGEKLQTELSYPVQTWTFGDQLAMVFLPGEVVVDYSLRLKREFDRTRLWINAYSNDVPCYIPSERILKEGGYEGGGAMLYYDRPTKLASGIEQKIVDEVHRQMPKQYLAPPGTEGVAPKSPEHSRRSIRTKPGLEVELVAAEPLIQSPVAIDWSADGRLWVCEMYDYPTGADQNWKPGGRVKVLSDSDGNGKYDTATVFIENIPFPTGVTAWGKGVFICAAPDIVFAQDTDGDGKADKVEKVFTGFATDNYQARVNSLSLGLDNWIYGGNGLLGGVITRTTGEKLDIRNHDFRFRPTTGPMETVAGLTQYGLARDDWGRWFGCDNSNALFAYPHEERYLRRNPHVSAPPASIVPKGDYDIGRVFPVSQTLERFNQPESANHITSACGLGIYRDDALGNELSGNAFVCEPVHNLVHRMILQEQDGLIAGRSRAADETDSEFLASSDNWFRPVQARTGPDGALYIVDMYRFLIEHPRWIPAERLAQLNVRAGADMGRIYRVKQNGAKLDAVRDLTKLDSAQLAAAMDSSNGTERDHVHIELLARREQWEAAAPALKKLAHQATLPQVRVQALCALEGIGELDRETLKVAVADADARVKAHAVRLCEGKRDRTGELVLSLVNDPSPLVRRQVAFSLGEWSDPCAGDALARLAMANRDDAEMRVAVLSSASHHCAKLLTAAEKMQDERWTVPLVATAAAASKDPALLAAALGAVLPENEAPVAAWQFEALASLIDRMNRNGAPADPRVVRAISAARTAAADAAAPEPLRQAALRIIGRAGAGAEEIALLCDLVTSSETSDKLRGSAIAALRKQTSAAVAERLLARWKQTSPAARSEVIALLIGRESWATELLKAVGKHQVQVNEISLADRQTLAQSPSNSIRKTAAEVLADSGPSAKRADVIARYKSAATLAGTPGRGAELFAKNCSACHVVGGVGHDIGPNLAALRTKDADYLVKNILDPNAVIEPRFVYYQIKLNDGRLLTGIIKSETSSSLTIASGAAGVASSIETVPRADVKEIRATSVSMMPEGFETALSPQDLADVIACLKSSAQRKDVAGNKPELVKQSSDGQAFLPASKAEIYGEQIVFESEFRNIGWWSGQGDYVIWRTRVEKAGEYDMYFDYACAQSAGGNAFAVEAGGRAITGVVPATAGDWSRYRQIKVGTVKLQAGEQRISIRPDAPVREALMDLRTVALVPTGTQPKWPAVSAPAIASAASGDELATNPQAVLRVILNPAKSNAAREAAINANPQFAADLVAEMTKDLESGAREYERIPWIWRVAIACGKRNDAGQIKRMLDVALPQENQPLRDWQAVVIGGGIINGISQQNLWPGDRVNEIISGDAALSSRWKRAITLAAKMVDNEKVPAGTRYDALRILGCENWEKHGEQLIKYLTKGTNDELQAGAVSALIDMKSEHAANAVLDAIEQKNVDAKVLRAEQAARLRTHSDAKVRQRAKLVLGD